MKPSNDLFDLIHTLSPAEKGYFKKYVQHDEGNGKSYVKLFDAINAQKEYDEEKLKKKFAKELSNFSAAKNYLYKSIIDSLKVTQRDVFAQTIDGLLSADLLASRRLFNQARQYLENVHELAEKNSGPGIHLMAFDRELMIASVENNRHELIRLTEEGMDKAAGWLEDLKTDMLVRRVVTWLTLYRMLYTGPSTDIERYEFIQKARQYASQLELLKLLPSHQVAMEQLNYIICEATGEFARGYQHVKNIISTIHQLELSEPGREAMLVTCLWNAGNYCLRHYPQEVMQYAEQLESFANVKKQSGLRLATALAERLRYNLLLLYYNQSGDTKNAKKIIDEIKPWMSKSGRTIPPRIISKLNYEIAVHYFGVINYRLSLLHLQHVRTNPDTDRNTRLSSIVMEMIIQYETGDMEYLQPLIKPLQNELNEYKMGDSFYQTAYDFFNQIVRNSEPRYEKRLLRELLDNIEASGDEVYNRNPALMKVLLPWLCSKKDKISFIEAVRNIHTAKLRSSKQDGDSKH